MNEQGNTTYKNLWDATKANSKKIFIAVNAYGREEVLKSISSPSALNHWKKNSKLTLKQAEGGK